MASCTVRSYCLQRVRSARNREAGSRSPSPCQFVRVSSLTPRPSSPISLDLLRRFIVGGPSPPPSHLTRSSGLHRGAHSAPDLGAQVRAGIGGRGRCHRQSIMPRPSPLASRPLACSSLPKPSLPQLFAPQPLFDLPPTTTTQTNPKQTAR